MSLRISIETQIKRLQKDVAELKITVMEQAEEIKKLKKGYYK